MKKILLLTATLLAAAAPAMAQVSVSIGQPGFYGRIDIGNFPQPNLIYANPVIIQQAPNYAGRPIYLRVPPGHAKKWSKHCASYNACGQQVYFVQDNWYNEVYAPQYRSQQSAYQGKQGGNGKGHDKDKGNGNGNGKGNGNGNGKGHDKD